MPSQDSSVPQDPQEEHQPRAVIAPLTADMQSIAFPDTTLSEEPFDINSYNLIEIWERKITQRLEELKKKNDNAQQDRERDIALAPLYLEVLYRQQKALQGETAFPQGTKVPRLHSQFELYDYVNQLYDNHRANKLPWPMRLRAAVLSIDSHHEMAYDIYADQRGISILSVDPANEQSHKHYIDDFNLTEQTLRNIISIDSEAIGVQKTSVGCGMHVCNGIKVFFKREDALTQNRHEVNLAKAAKAAGNHKIQFMQRASVFHDDSESDEEKTDRNYNAKNRFLPHDFFKTMQSFSRFADIPEADFVTVGKYRKETLEQYKVRVFKEMFLMSDRKQPNKKAKINTKIQRQRFRLYTDTLTLLDDLKQQHGENASDKLREIIEANTPMLPKNWQQSIPSWVTQSSDIISGPVHLLSNKAKKKLSDMTPAQQLKAIHELLDAAGNWKIASLRLATLEAIEHYHPRTMEELKTVFSRLTKLKDQWRAETPRTESRVLDTKANRTLYEVVKNFRLNIPAEKMADMLENCPPQWLDRLLNTNILSEKIQESVLLKKADVAIPVAMLEIMTLKNIKIGEEEIKDLADSFIPKLAQSNRVWAKERFIQWFDKAPIEIKEPLKNAMQKFFPQEIALQQKQENLLHLQNQQDRVLMLLEGLQLPLLHQQNDPQLSSLEETIRTHSNTINKMHKIAQRPIIPAQDAQDIEEHMQQLRNENYESQVTTLQQQELGLQQSSLQNLDTNLQTQVTSFQSLQPTLQDPVVHTDLTQLHQDVKQLLAGQVQPLLKIQPQLLSQELRQLDEQRTQLTNRHQAIEIRLTQLEQLPLAPPPLVPQETRIQRLRRGFRDLRCFHVELPNYGDLQPLDQLANVGDKSLSLDENKTDFHYKPYQPNSSIFDGNPALLLSEPQRIAKVFESTKNSFTLRSVEEHLQSIHPRGTAFTGTPLRDQRGSIDLEGMAYLKIIHFEKTSSGEKKIVPTLTTDNEEILVRVKSSDLENCLSKTCQLVTTSMRDGQVTFQPVSVAERKNSADGVKAKSDKVTRKKTL